VASRAPAFDVAVEIPLRWPVTATVRELRQWLDQNVKHRISIGTTFGHRNGLDGGKAWIKGWSNWVTREGIVSSLLSALELAAYRDNTAAILIGFESKSEAMLFKLTFGRAR